MKARFTLHLEVIDFQRDGESVMWSKVMHSDYLPARGDRVVIAADPAAVEGEQTPPACGRNMIVAGRTWDAVGGVDVDLRTCRLLGGYRDSPAGLHPRSQSPDADEIWRTPAEGDLWDRLVDGGWSVG